MGDAHGLKNTLTFVAIKESFNVFIKKRKEKFRMTLLLLIGCFFCFSFM